MAWRRLLRFIGNAFISLNSGSEVSELSNAGVGVTVGFMQPGGLPATPPVLPQVEPIKVPGPQPVGPMGNGWVAIRIASLATYLTPQEQALAAQGGRNIGRFLVSLADTVPGESDPAPGEIPKPDFCNSCIKASIWQNLNPQRTEIAKIRRRIG